MFKRKRCLLISLRKKFLIGSDDKSAPYCPHGATIVARTGTSLDTVFNLKSGGESSASYFCRVTETVRCVTADSILTEWGGGAVGADNAPSAARSQRRSKRYVSIYFHSLFSTYCGCSYLSFVFICMW